MVEETVQKFVEQLTIREQAWFYKKIELLIELGSSLEMPHIRHIRGSLWELRYCLNKNKFRVFYFNPEPGLYIAVHMIIKKTRTTPIQDIETAERRIKNYHLQLERHARKPAYIVNREFVYN